MLGVQNFNKNNATEQYFRAKETGGPLKEKLFFHFCRIINEANSVKMDEKKEMVYKCFVGKGNNS